MILLLKANDHHDPKTGRFASGGGLPSSAFIDSRASAEAYWKSHFAGKTMAITVHSGGREIPIRVRFDVANDHAFTSGHGERAFDARRAAAMWRIPAVIERPALRVRNQHADLLMERKVDGEHFTVVLTWRNAAKVYEFHSAHFKPALEVRQLLAGSDRAKNEGPLQKSEPSTVFAELQGAQRRDCSPRWLPESGSGTGMHGVTVAERLRASNAATTELLAKAADIDARLERLQARRDPVGIEIARWRRSGEPSDAQLRSGRYPKRRLTFAGFPIAVETEAGHVRRGVNRDGVQWEHRLPFAYGYFEGTLGVDGDAVDVFLGLHEDAPVAYVVRQMTVNRWDQYDEDKVMLGFADQSGAEAAFRSCYNDPRFKS